MAIDGTVENARISLTTEQPVKIVAGLKKASADDSNPRNIETKTYARRWLVLVIFVMYAAGNFSQWLEYSIISNIVTRYYNVSEVAISWTSLVFMVVYIIQIFPCSYLMDRIGMRWTVIIGASCTCIGSWLKVYSVSPERFYLGLIGQTITASGQIFVLTVPGRLAAAWFGSDEVSTATAIGVFGFQLGIAGSFIIPPMIVRNHDDLDDIGNDLSILFWSSAIFTTVAAVAVFLFFKEEPPLPPSTTRALQKISNSDTSAGILAPMKRLLTNRSYLALCNSFGILIGVTNAVSTLLNQLYLTHFKNGEAEAGQIGLIIIITGMFGTILFGIILDKTHMFKETISAVYILTLLGQIVFAVALLLEIKWMVYLAAALLGFFSTGYFSVGYEVCAEFTYPESDAAATAILNITNQVYGVFIVLIASAVIEAFGDFWAHIIIILTLLFGAIITVFTKDLQRRQSAKNSALRYTEVPVKDVIKSVNAS